MNRPTRWTAVLDGILPVVLPVVIGLVRVEGGLPGIVGKHARIIEAGVVFPFRSR
ncbi:MAG: hypothetical protein ACKOFE_08965 [Bacteroidota bacterium]